MTTTSLLQCAEQGPKETFADTKLCEARSAGEEGKKSQRNPLNINLDFSQVNYYKCALLNEAHSFGLRVNIDLFSVVGSIVHSPEIQARHFQGTQPGIKMQQIFFVGRGEFFFASL